MTAKSLLFVEGQVLEEPPECGPGRNEVVITTGFGNQLYTMVLRDKAVIEDPYLVLVKARAYAISQGQPYMGRVVPRSVRDFLVKSTVIP